jgi:hypothetical protein
MSPRAPISASRRPARAAAGSPPGTEGLPFAVELWDLRRDDVERLLGRAASASLARAIFEAAQVEHLGRRITLTRDQVILDQSG